MVNLYQVQFKAQWILNQRAFYCFIFFFLKVNLDPEKANQLGESSPKFIFAVVNPDPIVKEKRWTDGDLDLTILLKRWTETVKTWGG